MLPDLASESLSEVDCRPFIAVHGGTFIFLRYASIGLSPWRLRLLVASGAPSRKRLEVLGLFHG